MIKQSIRLTLLATLPVFAFLDSPLADETDADDVQSCISTRTLKSTAVVDDRNVLFIKKGKTIYHNILPKQCVGLSRYRAFSYTTLSGSLCNFDTIQVLDDFGGNGKSCRLGDFYPITIEDVPALIEMSRRPLEPLPEHTPEPEEIIVDPKEEPESTSD